MNNDEDWIPTRESLLKRIKDWDDHRSWTEFFDTYWRLIFRVARKSGLSNPEAHDVVQETLLSVAKQIPGFEYDAARGSFKAYLLRLTKWRICDQLRKRPRERLESDLIDDFGSDAPSLATFGSVEPQLEEIWDAEWEENIAAAALDRIKRRVNPKHYQLFDLFVLKNWPVERIVETMGVSAHQVYTAKSRISERLRKEIESLKHKEFTRPPVKFV